MNKDEKREYNKKYYQDNKNKILEQKRQYQRENMEKLLEYKRGKFATVMRAAINHIIHQKQKTSKYEAYLGCTCQELREYLIGQLPEGVALDNLWACGFSIDHIVPFAAFHHINDPTHLDCEFERKLVSHYLNLQILPGTDNMSKATAYNPADVERLKIKIAGLK